MAPLIASGQVAQVVVSTATLDPARLHALRQICADAGVRTLVASLEFQDATAPAPPQRYH